MTTAEMDPVDEPAWSRDERQEVRAYAVTRGRTRPTHVLRLLTHLVASPDAPSAARLGPEARKAVELCQKHPRAVVEIAGLLHLPVQSTRVLVSDLLDTHALIRIAPAAAATPGLEPDRDPAVLEKLLVRLREKFPDAAAKPRAAHAARVG